MLYTHAAAALLGAFIAAVGAWQVQSWRYTGQITQIKAEQLEAVNAATREARATESRRFTNVQEAQNAATKRAQIARADADRARSELDRLRNDIRERPACNVPNDTTSTSTEPSSQRDNVLLECLSSYEALGRDADLWKNDALMLRDAWPK